MPNIRVKAALSRISDDIQKVAQHAKLYSGIDEKEALLIDNTATDIAVAATHLAVMARKARGLPERSAESTIKAVRKALGFTHP